MSGGELIQAVAPERSGVTLSETSMVWVSTMGFGRTEAIEQALLQIAGAGEGEPGEDATVQSEGDRSHSRKHGNTEGAANPLLNAQASLHGGENTAPGEQSDRQRGGCSRSVAEQE